MYISKIKDFAGKTTYACDKHTAIGNYSNGMSIYFDDITGGIYDYVTQDGYNNLDTWVENAVNKQK